MLKQVFKYNKHLLNASKNMEFNFTYKYRQLYFKLTQIPDQAWLLHNPGQAFTQIS